MTNCTCAPISARLIAQCENCAHRDFAKALKALVAACQRAARTLQP
jgi:hypothetical protein